VAKQLRCDKFFKILRFLNFSNNDNDPDNNETNYSRLWKLRHIFDLLNDVHSNYYAPFRHMAPNIVTVHFMGRIILKHYIPKKYMFQNKMYNLATHDMVVYFRKDTTCAATDAIATSITTKQVSKSGRTWA
jgi:hypothetical protein